MSDWGIPNWRDASAYGNSSFWSYANWRWEFMRRQSDLRAYFDSRSCSAQKERQQLAIGATNQVFIAEMNCAINDPRFTLPEDPDAKLKFGYLRLHNPRISAIVPSQFFVETTDNHVKIADPALGCNSMKINEWEVGVIFDLTKPFETQIFAAKSYLEAANRMVRNDNVIVRLNFDKWLQHLRVLDARDAGASWTEIGRELGLMLGSYSTDTSKLKDAARSAYKNATEVVSKLRSFNTPPEAELPE